MAARRAMESITLDRGESHLKDELSPRYAELVYNGFWFSPERLALQAAVDTTQQYVTGVVRVKLYKARCSDASVVGALGATLTSTSFLCSFVLILVMMLLATWAGVVAEPVMLVSGKHVDTRSGLSPPVSSVSSSMSLLCWHHPASINRACPSSPGWQCLWAGERRRACLQGKMICRPPAGSVPHVFLKRMSCALHGHQQCIPPVKLPSCVCEGQRDHRGPEVAVQPVRREDRLFRGRRRPV